MAAFVLKCLGKDDEFLDFQGWGYPFESTWFFDVDCDMVEGVRDWDIFLRVRF